VIKSSVTQPQMHSAADAGPTLDVSGNNKSEMPTVSVSAAEHTVGDSCVAGADDSSLQLDTTLSSNADISLLDDPFIAIGASCEKDSLLEEPDCTTEDSDKKTTPLTLSPDSFSGEKAESCEVAEELVVPDTD